MGGPPNSQVSPLPSDLPFRLVSKTIGSGAYASIRKAVPHNRSGPVIAVKFINKAHAYRAGHLRPKQLLIELSLHASVCPHDNIIRYLSHGEDAAWVWLALELAEGGDLFDKIEADAGVGPDVAHFYFAQLTAAVAWCHSRGVAHRDIKPENMLLSAAGDLKLADFGLATRFLDPKSGARKACAMVCGSPPYIAPEILAVGHRGGAGGVGGVTDGAKRKADGDDRRGYDPQIADVWSCAIVLFVLLVGNTPWDAPVPAESWEYNEYLKTAGRTSDELWEGVPADALSLVRGMLCVDAARRFTFAQVRAHPWFTRSNPHLNEKGKVANPVTLATQMLENLRIDFEREVPASQQQPQRRRPQSLSTDEMDLDGRASTSLFSFTQPETPVSEIPFAASSDWEPAPRYRPGGGGGISASQPTGPSHPSSTAAAGTTTTIGPSQFPLSQYQNLTQDPSLSQFTPKPSVPLTLTQAARHFNDIVPAHSLARFMSPWALGALLPLVAGALHRLSVPVHVPTEALAGTEATVTLRIKTLDARRQPLHGSVVLETLDVGTGDSNDDRLVEVRFVKAKGDPLGWRRLFKHVAVLCREAVYVPTGQ